MAENKKFGYVRISDKDQNEERQVKAMEELGISGRDLFIDKASGKDTNRPQYQALKQMLRAGDTVVIKSIDRLSRNFVDIKNEWNEIVNVIGAEIEVIDMPVLNTTNKDNALIGKVVTDIVLTLLGYVAEQERAFIKQRQAEGIKVAKKNKKYAKPQIQAPANFKELFTKALDNEISHVQAMKELNLKKTTYYKLAKDLGLRTDKRPVPDNRKNKNE